MYRIFTVSLIYIIKGLLWLIDSDYRSNESITNDYKKFTHIENVDFNSDFAKASKVFRTVPYQTWILKTTNHQIIAADKHLIVLANGKTEWIENLKVGDLIKTDSGLEKVELVQDLEIKVHMYDLEIDSEDHLYYSDGILSHNTTCAAIYILWRSIFQENQTILIASNKSDSAIEVMDRIKFSYENLPQWLKPGVTVYNKKNVVFENNSEIITRATTKDTGRGLSISLLYLDEFGAVDPPAKQRDFWSAIRPTLSTGGDCIITSTPISDEDTFAQVWYSANDIFDSYGHEHPRGIGKNGFKAVKFTWEVHPDRDEAWAEQERAVIGIDRFKREHECEFISDSDTLIDPIKLAAMRGVTPEFSTGQTRWYEKIKANRTYLVALDPCMGTGGDFSAIQVFQLPEMIQVAEWQHNRTAIGGQVKTLMDILKYIDNTLRSDYNQHGEPEIYWTIENNSIGEAANIVIKETGIEKFPGSYISEPKKSKGHYSKVRKGFTTTNKSKLEACAKFKSLVERDKMIIKSKPLISELKVFVSRGASYGAKSREHDDLVSACLIIVRLLQIVMKFNDELEESLGENVDNDDDGLMPLPISVLSTY